jgi:hypothetical protein
MDKNRVQGASVGPAGHLPRSVDRRRRHDRRMEVPRVRLLQPARHQARRNSGTVQATNPGDHAKGQGCHSYQRGARNARPNLYRRRHVGSGGRRLGGGGQPIRPRYSAVAGAVRTTLLSGLADRITQPLVALATTSRSVEPVAGATHRKRGIISKPIETTSAPRSPLNTSSSRPPTPRPHSPSTRKWLSGPDGYNSHCNDGQPHAHDKNIRNVIWLRGLQDRSINHLVPPENSIIITISYIWRARRIYNYLKLIFREINMAFPWVPCAFSASAGAARSFS